MAFFDESGDVFSMKKRGTLHEESITHVKLIDGISALIGEPKSQWKSDNWKIAKLDFPKDSWTPEEIKTFWRNYEVRVYPANHTNRKVPPVVNAGTFHINERGKYRWLICERGPKEESIQNQLKKLD